MAQRATPVTLASLPVELRQAILSKVESPRTLEVATAAAKCLAEALDANGGHLIIEEVLTRAIPQPLLPEVIALLQARRTQGRDNDTLAQLQTDYFDSIMQHNFTRHRCTLPETVFVDDLYRVIRQLSTDFVSKALSRHPVSDAVVSDPDPPGERELYRIHRSFFRFELYCNLFHRDRDRRMVTTDGRMRLPLNLPQRDLFLSRFSPWENEQLACIYDFLFNLVAELFDDVAAHDVEWGEDSRQYLGATQLNGDGFGDHYLSRGLEFISQLLAASPNYSEYCKILKVNLGVCSFFLKHRLVKLNMMTESTDMTEYTTPLADFDNEQLNRVIPPPAVPEADPGPKQVWEVVHQQMNRGDFIMSEDHEVLRERGYVFWDFDRLRNWGLLEIPWNPGRTSSHYPARQDHAKMMASFERRTEIYFNGGRGWWSEDDESHVVYSN